MSYFSSFPNLYYNFNIKGKPRIIIVKDVALNVRFIQDVVNGIQFFNKYTIQDNESPEYIAEKFYQRADYHWILMLYNQKYDYLNDWPKSDAELEAYIKEKYGEGNENNQHIIYGNPHYVNESGDTFFKVDPETGNDISDSVPFSKKITNRDYELTMNENKRELKIIDSRLIPQIIEEFSAAFEVINA